jgi:23S rRNA (uracil1939-C5)-methyltransferase
LKKGQEMEGVISSLEFPNKGTLKIEDRKIIVKNTLPGQKVRFRILKAKKKQM